MPITFRAAPTVEVGDIVNSTHLEALAAGFNDRIRSGVGDPVFRIFFMMFGLFRQVRNPSEDGNAWPADAEFFESYAMFKPGDVTWPVAGPGDYEGLNLVSYMPEFVYGVANPSIDLDSEPDRINDVDVSPSGSSLSTAWETGKSQRGAVDFAYSIMGAPAIKAATEHYKIERGHGSYGKHGTAYGGFMPFSLLGELGCRLNKTKDVLDRVLNFYIKDFNDFDFELFFGSQYHLTPNKGHRVVVGTDPETEEEIYGVEADYVTLGFYSAVPVGTYTASYAYDSRCVLGSFYVSTSNLSAAVDINVMSGSDILRTIHLQPDGGGFAEKLEVFNDQPCPAPLSFRLATPLTFIGGAGFIEFECTEQLRAKPQIPDAYLVLRLAGGVDGVGGEQISDDYFATGAILGNGCPENDPVAGNQNAIFEVGRKMAEYLRVVRRHLLRGYALEAGKSVLWFKREETTDGSHADWFEGIGPARTPIASGSLQLGLEYIVRSTTGLVTYNGTDYADGETFITVRDEEDVPVLTYSITDDAEVYLYNGIISEAPPGGWTNEWVMDANFQVYNDSITSFFKPPIFADYFALSNRCHLLNARINYLDLNNRDVSLQFSYGQELNLAPEAPSAFNYIRGFNIPMDTPADGDEDTGELQFYKSCRIYEPPVEIESIIREMVEGEEQVKITFTGRFHHCDSAVSSVPRDIGSWNISALLQEPYRTMENGIREYLAVRGSGCSLKYGDHATLITGGFSGAFRGACYPHFFFMKLIPTPYLDDNDDQDDDDSLIVADPPMVQMEFYLRAMCEGYIDGAGTLSEICDDLGNCEMICFDGNYDFTFRNLCLKAFGGEWGLSMLPGFGPYGATGDERSTPIRPEHPKGNGILPNTVMYAETFNQYSACLNMLTKVRVELPLNYQTKTTMYRSYYPLDAGVVGCLPPPGLCPEFQDCEYRPVDCANWMLQLEQWYPTGGLYAFSDGHSIIGSLPGGDDTNEDVSSLQSSYWIPDPDNPGQYIVNPYSEFQWRPAGSPSFHTDLNATIAMSYTPGFYPNGSVVCMNIGGSCTRVRRVDKLVVDLRIDPFSEALWALPPHLASSLDSFGISGKVTYYRQWTKNNGSDCPGNPGPCARPPGAPDYSFCWNYMAASANTEEECVPYICPELMTDTSQECLTIYGGQSIRLTPKPLMTSMVYFMNASLGVNIISLPSSSSVNFQGSSCVTGNFIQAELIGIPPTPVLTLS